MGGAIGLAIVTGAFNSLVQSRLAGILSTEELDLLFQSPDIITSFSPEVQAAVRFAYADGYSLQVKILSGLAAGQIPASMLMWQRKQILV